MKNILFLLLISSLLLAAACNTEDDMTPTTENTHDILRCKINGEDWEPKGGDLFSTQPYDLYYYINDGLFTLNGSRSLETTRQAIRIFLNNVNIGNNEIANNSYIFADELNPNDCEWYYKDTTYNNLVYIQDIDTLKYFIKGTFQFTCANNCGDTLNVSDGYFDLNYKF